MFSATYSSDFYHFQRNLFVTAGCSYLPTMGTSVEFQIFLSLMVQDAITQFSTEDITSITLELSDPIGAGGSGKVYKGQLPASGLLVAVKVLKENKVVEETFMNEITTMHKSPHPNIVKLHGFCFEDEMKAIVCEYMDMGSLDEILYENDQSIEWGKLYEVAVEIAKVLSYLHSNGNQQIIHYDVKPANVLLDSNMPPKITDYGLTKFLKKDLNHFKVTKVRGTRGYAAPETLEPYLQVTCKCDVYSFGVMLFDILGWKGNQERTIWLPKEAWHKYEEGQLEDFIIDCDTGAGNRRRAKILSMVGFWCIQFISDMRPSMRDVTNMLENEILVTAPPNPFYPSRSMPEPIPSMRPS